MISVMDGCCSTAYWRRKKRKKEEREKNCEKKREIQSFRALFLSIVGKRQHNSVPSFVIRCAK